MKAAQPLSAREYVKIAGLMMAAGFLLLFLFVILTLKLVPSDALDRFYYVVLIVWGIVAAILLFGVMRSYARVTYNEFGAAIELGGPAAIAALVVVGGVFFVPRTDTFDLTVRVHGTDQPLIQAGKILLELDNDTRNGIIRDGEADFKGIPHIFLGKRIKALPQVDGYWQQYQELLLSGKAVDLTLTRQLEQNLLRGRVFPTPKNGRRTTILVETEPVTTTPDEYGRFQVLVHEAVGKRIRITVCENARTVYDDYQTVSTEPLEIRTHKPGLQCSR